MPLFSDQPYVILKGCGSYLPQNTMTNKEFEKTLDTTDEWIRARTGIHERHIASPHETTASLAACAVRNAFKDANIPLQPGSVDLIICATTTPDETFPSLATKLQNILSLGPCPAFDVQAVCSGYLYALSLANTLLITGQATRALVVGAETMSRLLDWKDRSTCILFGDGAGATILEAQPSTHDPYRGILSHYLNADGTFYHDLMTQGGVSTSQNAGRITMNGRKVFKYAVEAMAQSIQNVLTQSHMSIDDVDLCVPHQANMRILEAVAERVHLPFEKVICVLDRHANTSAASIPLALCAARQSHRLKEGDLVLLSAMGAGFSWGSLLWRL